MSRIPRVTAIGGIAVESPPDECILCTTMESSPSTTTRVSDARNSATDTVHHREIGGSLKATCPW